MVNSSKRGRCRIIGGKWRGRIITFNDAEGLRPSTDRIRETVFNWLQPYMFNSICLDVFAGSGVLGFEALSRGADKIVFIEQNIKTVKKINENIALLKTKSASVFHQDALSWLSAVKDADRDKTVFNLVFLDPPFHSDLLANSCGLLEGSGCLAEDAIIYVEHAVDKRFIAPDSWVCLKEKKSGQVSYKLFERRA